MASATIVCITDRTGEIWSCDLGRGLRVVGVVLRSDGPIDSVGGTRHKILELTCDETYGLVDGVWHEESPWERKYHMRRLA